MNRTTRCILVGFSAALLMAPPGAPHAAKLVTDKVDWPAFLNRQDAIWEALPAHFDYGDFLGNGLLGAMICRDGDEGTRWSVAPRTRSGNHESD